jgi:DNA modification methylase
MATYKINHANIKEWAANYDGEPFDAILCDPPYELGFMGKSWDSSGIAFDTEMWVDLFRHIKPGGHLLAFSGSRTYHRMAVAIEDAGFEIRDMIEYIYGSGFPKSTNIYKQLKKQCNCGNMEVYENRVQQVGSSREQEAEYYLRFMLERNVQTTKSADKERGQVLQSSVSKQSTHDERQASVAGLSVSERREESSLEERSNLQATKGELQGSQIRQMSRGVSNNGEERRLHNGTQISDGSTPEHNADEDSSSSSHRPQSEQQQYREPCTFCQQWGTQATRSMGTGSALKPAHEPICFARKPLDGTLASNYLKHGTGGLNIDGTRVGTENIQVNRHSGYNSNSLVESTKGKWKGESEQVTGRFPANLIHDGSDEVKAVFPDSKSSSSVRHNNKTIGGNGKYQGGVAMDTYGHGDSGSSARFFYTAKASKSERNAGLEGFEVKRLEGRDVGQDERNVPYKNRNTPTANQHPTVKPLSLTKYLATLIKPPTGGRLLVPFSGSGSEMIGALQAGWEYVEGVELTEEYIPIAEARIKYWTEKKEEESKQMELI